MAKIRIDIDEKKLVKVLMLKGSNGKTSYDLAVENELFSGTLEEWIESFTTPENYITRGEFQKVTQAEYDALKQAGQLVRNCFYLITDDTTLDDLQEAIDEIATNVQNNTDDISDLKDDVQNNTDDINTLNNKFVDFEFTQTSNGTLILNTNVFNWLSNGSPLTARIRAKISLYNDDEDYQVKYAFLPLIKYQVNENPSSSFEGYELDFYFGSNDYNLLLIQDDNSTYHTINFEKIEKEEIHLYKHDLIWGQTSQAQYITFTLYTTSPDNITYKTLKDYMSYGVSISVSGIIEYNDIKYVASHLYYQTFYQSSTDYQYMVKGYSSSGSIISSIGTTISASIFPLVDIITQIY